MPDVEARLKEQVERIASAARTAGRDPSEVALIAVSKRHGPERIREAYEAGQRDFGENYVQELVAKAEALSDLPDIRWHFIGHLQSNKARFVAGIVDRVHTIHSVKLAKELGKRMARRRQAGTSAEPLGVLVEVNVGGESSKSGCSADDVSAVLSAIDEQPLLDVRGLMTIPPASEDPAAARLYFEQLMALREAHGGAERLPEMSFGMSADAEVAIGAGATFVRIGTAIFGPRPQ